jgi:uncharacterized protein YkwD
MRDSRVVHASAALSGAGCVLFAAVAAAGAAVVPPLPPLPPLPAPVPSLVGGPDPAAGSSAQSAPHSQPAVSSGTTRTSVAAPLQRLVAAEINAVRVRFGLPRLGSSPQLSRAGVEHARDLAVAGYFSHDWSDGSPFASWIKRFYPPGSARAWSAAENIGWAEQDVTAPQAVEMWLASPAHRLVLLSKTWRQVGVGVIRADGAAGPYGGQSVVILAAEFGARR